MKTFPVHVRNMLEGLRKQSKATTDLLWLCVPNSLFNTDSMNIKSQQNKIELVTRLGKWLTFAWVVSGIGWGGCGWGRAPLLVHGLCHLARLTHGDADWAGPATPSRTTPGRRQPTVYHLIKAQVSSLTLLASKSCILFHKKRWSGLSWPSPKIEFWPKRSKISAESALSTLWRVRRLKGSCSSGSKARWRLLATWGFFNIQK